MLANIWFFYLGTFTAFVLFWTIPSDRPQLRLNMLTLISAFMVFIYSPGGFLAACILVLVPLSAQVAFRLHRKSYMFWGFVLLSLTPLIGLRLLTDQSFFIAFGVAFGTVKSLGLVFTAYGGRQVLHLRNVALMIFFFPLFTVGPVEKISAFYTENFANRFDIVKIAYGIYRITIGMFIVMFICGDVLIPLRDEWFGRSLSDIENFTQLQALGFIFVSFLYTYLNFEGFSAIAIGIGRLFGVNIIENFDRPLMVTNVADFWKRYHISMGNWINQFIFFPLVIWMKKPWASYAATLIAFVLFGLWHAFNLNYVVWGLGNGLGVALVHFGISNKVFPLVKKTGPIKLGLSCLTGGVSLAYVAWLQTFANLESLTAGLRLTQKLIGL